MKIYTRRGDQGSTSLLDGTKVSKSDQRLEAYGTLDELNSHLGLLISMLHGDTLFEKERADLAQVQVWLFRLGSHLACSDKELAKKLPSFDEEYTEIMELHIDNLDNELPDLKNFILPGGHRASSQAHICRTVARRAERQISDLNDLAPLDVPAIAFINRLSDYFFTFARVINHRKKVASVEWIP